MVPRIALGISDFREVRGGAYTYVDKSLLVRDIIQDGAAVILLPRPRRFGKTTNLSMLRCFFENCDEDLWPIFADLAVIQAVLNRNLARAIEVKYMVDITELIKLSKDDAVKQSYRAGEKRGEKRGEAKGKAESILAVLSARGIPVSGPVNQRIVRCSDMSKLEHWLKQAMTVDSAEALFSA